MVCAPVPSPGVGMVSLVTGHGVTEVPRQGVPQLDLLGHSPLLYLTSPLQPKATGASYCRAPISME